RMDLLPRHAIGNRPPPTALPATSELLLHLGMADIGLAAAMIDRESTGASLERSVAHLFDLDTLPTEWIGYDGVDVVVLTTGDKTFVERLIADRRRFEALKKWVELGGRLVVGCGEHAPDFLKGGGPLAALLPGKFAELVRLPQTRTLEVYSA